MSKKRVYAALELADGEVRLAVMEVYEGRANVLRIERAPAAGLSGTTITDEASVVASIRQALTAAQAALGYRIERVVLLVPSVNVKDSSQKIRVGIEDGTKTVRLFHIQQGLTRAQQLRRDDDAVFVNANRIQYEVNGETSSKLPLSEQCEEFVMDVDLLYADKDTVYAYARAVEQANLEILDLVLDSYAAAQETAALAQSSERPVIQVQLEANHTLLTYFQDGRLRSSFDLDKGYMWFMEPLRKKYRLGREVTFRLLQNCFSTDMQDSSVIIYIEQKEDQRVEITAGELAKTVVPRIREWIAGINEACAPIVNRGKVKYIVTGKGSNIPVLKELEPAFNAPARVYVETSVGARDGAFVSLLGSVYALMDINRIRHDDRISVNNNELEASIDQINARSHHGDGGFTRQMKSVVLTDEG